MVSKRLNKILRNAIRSNNYIAGSKEVLQHISKARIVILSSSLKEDLKAKIEDACKANNIAIYPLSNTSRELGRLCNKPFRISALSITSIEDQDLEELLKEINKS